MTIRKTLALLALCAALSALALPGFAQSGTWTATNQMANSTENAVAVLLQNGKVLVAGGDLGTLILPLRNAQLYDPSTNSWTATAKMVALRGFFAGTLLPNSQVLMAGGTNGVIKSNGYDLTILKSAELYDPAGGKFVATSPMTTARMSDVATLLPNGKVLITGGLNVYKPRLRYAVATASAELFDPATGTWLSAGSMSVPRAGHSAIVMQNGKVLVVGSGKADIYDPASNTWTPTGSPLSASTGTPAVLLQNGMILAANPLGTAELYNPATGTWSATGSMSTTHNGGMVLLASGKALIIGGTAGACELYDPLSGTWSPTGSLISSRTGAPATLLPDGRVLVSGGAPVWWNGEVYTP